MAHTCTCTCVYQSRDEPDIDYKKRNNLEQVYIILSFLIVITIYINLHCTHLIKRGSDNAVQYSLAVSPVHDHEGMELVLGHRVGEL